MTTPTMPSASTPSPFLSLAMIEAMPEPTDIDRERVRAVMLREQFLASGALFGFLDAYRSDIAGPVVKPANDYRNEWENTDRVDTSVNLTYTAICSAECEQNDVVKEAEALFARIVARRKTHIEQLRGEGYVVADGVVEACTSPGHCALGAMLVAAGRSEGYVMLMPSTPLDWCDSDRLLFWKAFGLTPTQGNAIYAANDREIGLVEVGGIDPDDLPDHALDTNNRAAELGHPVPRTRNTAKEMVEWLRAESAVRCDRVLAAIDKMEFDPSDRPSVQRPVLVFRNDGAEEVEW